MTFDKNWEELIYDKSQQVNKYPFDQIVTLVNRNFNRKNILTKKFRAIDLGCGTGNNLKFLLDFGFNEVVGIDGSSSAIKIAKEFLKNNKANLFVQDFKNISSEDSYFDLCIDRGSITHNYFNSIESVFNEVYRILKKNGFFISILFSQDHYAYKKTQISNNSSVAFKEEINSDKGLVTTFFSYKQIIKLFNKFKIINITHDIKKDITNDCIDAMWVVVVKK